MRLLIATSAGSGNAIPWSLIERKLTRGNSLVVSLSSHRDAWSARAGYVIAIPAYLEALDEGPTPFDAAAATFSLAAPLLPPPPDAVDPVDFLSRLAAALPGATPVAETMESALKARAEAIHKSGRGEVFAYAGGESKPLTAFDSPEGLWKTLLEGGCWVDSRTGLDAPSRFSFLGGNFDGVAAAALQRPARYVSASAAPLEGSAPAAAAQAAGETHNPTVAQDPNALALLPFGWKGDSGMGAASPVMSKLYQESNLRGGAGQASMNPETGRARGLSHGKPASIRTDCGSAIVEVRFDPAVMPGVIQVAVGLDSMRLGREDEAQAAAASILDLCGPAEGGTWRIARAEVSKA